MKHITMSFTAYVPRPFQKTLWRPGMLSMSFRHVLVAGTVAISTLARVHSNLLPLIEESYQFSEIHASSCWPNSEHGTE